MPLIHEVLKRTNICAQKPLQNTAIFYVHHPLNTSVHVLRALLSLGLDPKNLFVLGKRYSECKTVVDTIRHMGAHYPSCSEQIGIGHFESSFAQDIHWLWFSLKEHVQRISTVQRLMILDHGGHAITTVPAELIKNYPIIGIEKTSAGIIRYEQIGLPPFPIIGMATCATKKILESPLIAEAIIKKIHDVILCTQDVNCLCYGIIGFGAIGQAIANYLCSRNIQVLVYDNNHAVRNNTQNMRFVTSVSELILESDCIFGCTGRDVFDCQSVLRSKTNKILISCSSEDKEFLSVLRYIANQKNCAGLDPMQDINYTTPQGGTLLILKGGFPINFDHSGESVPAHDIQLTRALVVGSVVQAISCFKDSHELHHNGLYALNAYIQKYIACTWLSMQPSKRFSLEIQNSFQNPLWISKHSAGQEMKCAIALNFMDKKDAYHNSTPYSLGMT